MVREINGLNSPQINSSTRSAKATGGEAKPAADNSSSASSKDTVVISAEARALSKLAQQAPDVDQERVEALRTAINNGSYEVNSRSVAEKLLQNEQDFNV